MPIYTFECACGAETEDLFPINTDSIVCPVCGRTVTKKMFKGRLGFNENKLKMDREHEVWVESASQRTSKKEL